MDAAISQLLTYCQADPVFFEPPWHLRDEGSLLGVSRRPAPAGWATGRDRLWTVLEPAGSTLPDQGWKVHVSALPDDAEEVCDRVWDFCVEHGVTAKFLRSLAAVRLLNGKYTDRASSGKVVTLYPRDDEALAQLLPALARALPPVPGPYVLSDLRYEDSPLYVRYGAFRPMTYTEPNGDVVHAIRAPDGRLVPDGRAPAFTVPEWVTVPAVLRESLARRNAGGADDFPYRIERPLHFANSGGVYLARERETGRYVVLLEARPHAGLDPAGDDAVARLARERAALERLAGLDCVPRLLGSLRVWEHEFLVEEYVEGSTLLAEVFDRYPLAGPEPAPEALAEYVEWATDVLAKVDRALTAVHSRGLRHVDLHPANVIVRPDGSVALLDFELAADLADERRPVLAAPGFAAPPGLSGRAADDYVLNCLRQWVFLPITPLQDRDRAKPASLAEVVAEHFPVPPGFARRMVRRFGGDLPADAAGELFAEPDWPAIRAAIAAGIAATATPGRTDRLYPGDPQLWSSGGHPVAHGAAGVLWALHSVGAEVPAEHVDWLVAATRRAADSRPGLLDGLHGVAATLDLLGRRDDALEVLERARKLHGELVQPGVHGGLAGAGLGLLHFAAATGDEELAAEAAATGERLAAELADEASVLLPATGRVGLEHGLTGVAYFLLRLHEDTGDPRWLALAGDALRREAGRGERLPDGTFQLLENNRYLSYLSAGSLGLALVLERYLRLGGPPEPAFDGVVDGARRACRATFVRHPFLFLGRAGTIAGLSLLDREDDRPVVARHVRRLGWHAVSHEGHLAFPGNQLLRLSADLATGAAGVLAALGVAFDRNASVTPLLDLRLPAVADEGRR